MSDDLLDRARRQVRGIKDPSVRERLIIDLIDRVRDTEGRLDSAIDAYDSWRNHALDARSDLDEARAKLDRLTAWATQVRATRQRGDIEYNVASDVLAIVRGETDV